MVPEQIEREIAIAAPVERVWAALTDADQIGVWFGDAGAEIDLRPGGTLTIRWREYGAYHTTIERLEPPRYFSWRWTSEAGEAPRPDNSTLVEFSLTPEGGGTRLRVVESGFCGLNTTEDRRAQRARENTQGWQAELDELQQFLQQQEAR